MKEDNIKKMDNELRNKFSEFESNPSISAKDKIFQEIKELHKVKELPEEEVWVQKKHPENNRYIVYAIAASILFALLSVIFFFVLKDSSSDKIAKDDNKEDSSVTEGQGTYHASDLVTYSTQGEMVTVALPDNSKVYINKNSVLSYTSSSFNKRERAVQLDGEAYFDVRPNTQKPFVIYSNRSRIEVLGTSFNVKSNGTEEVIVEEGKVSFSPKSDPDNKLILNKGMKGILDSINNLHSAKATNPNAISWKKKKLVFSKTPMKEVIYEIEKYFGMDIIIKQATILNCRYTGVFNNPTKEKVLEIISLSIHGSFRKDNDSYVLTGKGCK